MANMAVAVSNSKIVSVSGRFQRHTSRRITLLEGTASGGRWGPPKAFSVLYLGRPLDSVAIEAYRHIVDATEGMTARAVAPRKLWTVDVDVTDILDIRDPQSRVALGLTDDDLHGDIDDYNACQEVARAANQLGLHGIVAPAAQGNGETLALFDTKLPVSEFPTVMDVDENWRLPTDPRILHAVGRGEQTANGPK